MKQLVATLASWSVSACFGLLVLLRWREREREPKVLCPTAIPYPNRNLKYLYIQDNLMQLRQDIINYYLLPVKSLGLGTWNGFHHWRVSQLQDSDLDSKSLEVKTVDGYQGREKEAQRAYRDVAAVVKICFQLNLESEQWTFERCHSKKFSSPSSIVNCTRDIFRDTLISLTNHDSIGNWVAFANSGQGFLDNIQAIKQKLKYWEKAPSKRYKKEFGGFGILLAILHTLKLQGQLFQRFRGI